MFLSNESIKVLRDRIQRKMNENKDCLFFTYKFLPEEFTYINQLVQKDLYKKQKWYSPTPISHSSTCSSLSCSCCCSSRSGQPLSLPIKIPTTYREFPQRQQQHRYTKYNPSNDSDADSESEYGPYLPPRPDPITISYTDVPFMDRSSTPHPFT